MAMKIARTLLASDTSVDTVDRAERLFSYISSIIKDLPGADEETDEDVSTLPNQDGVQILPCACLQPSESRVLYLNIL